jgi:hypothetical protein
MVRDIEIALGELRGKFMGAKRIEAFRLAYNCEPKLWTEPDLKVESDFIKACKLINVKDAYSEFNTSVQTALSKLPVSDKPIELEE